MGFVASRKQNSGVREMGDVQRTSGLTKHKSVRTLLIQKREILLLRNVAGAGGGH